MRENHTKVIKREQLEEPQNKSESLLDNVTVFSNGSMQHQGQDGGGDAKCRPWWFRLPVIFLLLITLHIVLVTSAHYHWPSSGMVRMVMTMIKITAYFKGNICLSIFKFLVQEIKRQVSLHILILKRRKAETTTKKALNTRQECELHPVIAGEPLKGLNPRSDEVKCCLP